jgi:hypothetical protein
MQVTTLPAADHSLRSAATQAVAPVATAGLLAVVAVGLGWRGADWPAQLLRLEIVERDGPAVWNNLWFAGHHTPGYGILFPVLGAVLGATAVAIASCIVAAGSFHFLVRGAGRRSTAASVVFAAGTVVNVAVGRLTFALGLAIALAALAAVRHRRRWVATVLVVATAPASPVAAMMLALALAAWGLHEKRTWLLGLAAAAAAPVAAAALLFPQGGRFPFLPGAFAWSIVVAAIIVGATDACVVRLGAGLYALACTATFLVPNPLGANATRLGMFLAAPVIVLTARRLRSPHIAIALAAMVWWQWSPAFDGVARAGLDPSSAAAYHEPLVDAVLAAGDPEGRIEVVPTRRHWETVYVASELPLARGWERQLDIGRNAIFYEPGLDPDTYHRWLRDHAVQFVALADVPVDPSAHQEAALVRNGLPFLEPVWRNAHWRLWRVVDAEPLVEGPARLVQVGATEIVLDVKAAESVLVRVRYSSHWSLDRTGCVEASPDGWTIVRPEQLGRVSLRPVLARSIPVIGPLDDCRS